MPTLVSNYVPHGVQITLQSENGMFYVGICPTGLPLTSTLTSTPTQACSASGHSPRVDTRTPT